MKSKFPKRGRDTSYYHEEEDGLHHVFGSDTGHSYASYSSKKEALEKVKEMNSSLKEDIHSAYQNLSAHVLGSKATSLPDAMAAIKALLSQKAAKLISEASCKMTPHLDLHDEIGHHEEVMAQHNRKAMSEMQNHKMTASK